MAACEWFVLFEPSGLHLHCCVEEVGELLDLSTNHWWDVFRLRPGHHLVNRATAGIVAIIPIESCASAGSIIDAAVHYSKVVLGPRYTHAFGFSRDVGNRRRSLCFC